MRNIWRGDGTTLHKFVRILLHLTPFCIRRQVRYPPLWPLAPCAPPPPVWVGVHEEIQVDDDGDDGEVCARCMKKYF